MVNSIEEHLLSLLESSSSTGLVLYAKYEDYVIEKFSTLFAELNKNIPQMKRLMKNIALKHQVLIIDLASEKYLFSLKKFDSFRHCSKTHLDPQVSQLNKICKVNIPHKNHIM